MFFVQELAEKICASTYDLVSEESHTRAKLAFLDTLIVILLGYDDEASCLIRKTVPQDQSDESGVLGLDMRMSALDAALVNGVAAHALDFDDTSNTLGGHPSAAIIPALFALSTKSRASGKAFIGAFIAGLETQAMMARTVNFYHYGKGWHPTATLGVFGAAAACSRLAAFDSRQVATALALAASLSAGIKANFGSMAKLLHIGSANRNGLLASYLAGQGFTAKMDVMEHEHGFFNVYNGPGNYAPVDIGKAWGHPLDIVSPGIGVKQYPCCDSTHAGVDLCLRARTQGGFSWEDIAKITVSINPLRLKHVNRANPISSVDAKFSVQYCMAYSLIHGYVDIAAFAEDRLNDPGVRNLMSRISARPYEMDESIPENSHVTRVVIEGRNRILFDETLFSPVGRSADVDQMARIVGKKFDHFIPELIGNERAEVLKRTILHMEDCDDMRSIEQMCCV